MVNNETIVNKIIPIETIVEIANYLEEQQEKYNRLFKKDEEKNKGLKFYEQEHEYKRGYTRLRYTIGFKDGREITEDGYNWFIGMLVNLKPIKYITISSTIDYNTNYKNRESYENKRLTTVVYFHEDSIRINVDGSKMEDEICKNYSYLKSIIENNDERYNKTVKNRNFRIQSFCLTIGIILSYIIYFILNGMEADLPEAAIQILKNKYGIIIGQWFIAALGGNILGLPIMMAFYKNIVPKTKYSHYSKSSKKFIYVDNIEDYVSHNEVQIGKFANNGRNRILIEKIYKVTSKIVLLQLAISTLLFFIIK